MSSQYLEDGKGAAYKARVTSDGSVQAQPAESGADTKNYVLGPASLEIADEEPNRRQIQVQNLSEANDVFVKLGSGATTSDLKIAPGATYSFPPGVSYQGVVHGMSPGGAPVVVVQFKY